MAARHLQATDHYAKPNRTNRAGSSSTKTMHHRTLAAALLLAFPPAALSQSSEPPDIKELSSVVLHLSGPSTPIAPWSASEWTLTIANGGQSSLPFSPESLGIHGYRGVRISVQVQQVPSPAGGGQGLKSSDAPGSSNEELPWLTLPANPFEHGHSQGGTTTGIKY